MHHIMMKDKRGTMKAMVAIIGILVLSELAAIIPTTFLALDAIVGPASCLQMPFLGATFTKDKRTTFIDGLVPHCHQGY